MSNEQEEWKAGLQKLKHEKNSFELHKRAMVVAERLDLLDNQCKSAAMASEQKVLKKEGKLAQKQFDYILILHNEVLAEKTALKSTPNESSTENPASTTGEPLATSGDDWGWFFDQHYVADLACAIKDTPPDEGLALLLLLLHKTHPPMSKRLHLMMVLLRQLFRIKAPSLQIHPLMILPLLQKSIFQSNPLQQQVSQSKR